MIRRHYLKVSLHDDTVIIQDGLNTVEAEYLSSDANSLHVAVGNEIRTYVELSFQGRTSSHQHFIGRLV